MPIVKRFNKYQGLRDIDVLVEEQGLSSRYFNVTGMPTEIPQGKSSFLVGGSSFLKNNIEIKIEMIDSAGRTVYMEPVSNYLEGGGRRVSIEVYPDTAPGTAQLYLVSELKNNYKSISEGEQSFDDITDVIVPTPSTSDVPLEFQGVYNVRYVMPVMINTTIPNTEPILYYKQPRLTVNEIVKGFVHELTPSSSYDVSGSLSINRIQGSQVESAPPTPEDGQPTGITESDRNDVGKALSIFKNRRRRKRDPFRNSLFGKRGRKMRRSSPEVDKSTGVINNVTATPENAENTITSTFVGETLNINNITIDASPLQGQPFTITGSYTTQIKKVINNNTFIPMDDFTVTLMNGEKFPVDITNASFTASIKPTPGFLISETEFRSFADITIGNLRTFSGDVYKAIVYGKSKGSLGDFEPMYEAFIESPEVLVDKLSPTGFSSTSYFFTQSIVDAYWNVTNGTAVESDEVIIDGVTISGSNYTYSQSVDFTTKHVYDLEPNVSYNVEFNTYYYKANKEQEDGSVESEAIMEVYVTGSKAGNKELLGRVDVGEGNEGNIDGIFKSFVSAPNSPKMALEFHIKAGRFILQDLSVRPTSETNFNPDYHRVIVPMPHPMPVKPDTYDFVVEFFDVNNNIAETFANTENVEFTGAPIMISGPGNFLSGSMMLGSGMELYGGSAFLRTVGYRGMEHALANNKGGFMVFSGSIGGPSAPKNLITSSEDYDGVGFEVVDAHDANNVRFLKFGTKPSRFEVVTDQFFFGKNNSQFVSGALGNIEISSSKLHLKPDGDIIVNKVTAQEGTIGAFQIIDGKISGSNITFNATRSQIFKTDQGPGSDTSATFEEKRNEYYIDFTPSESIDKVNGYRPGYYIKMGPSFMVDKDGILIASGAVFEGTVSASKGIIGGFTTDENAFSSTGVFISGSPLIGGANDDRYKVISTANFNLKQNGDITGSNVLFTGGKIGGFTINSSTITANNFTLDPDNKSISLGSGDDVFIADADTGIQLGDSTFDDAEFSVTTAGVMKATSGTVGGWTLGAEELTGGEMIIRRDGTIESAGFASDVPGSGFRLTAISGGFLEVENARIRGTLSTAVFEKESVNAVGGQLYVANSTVLTASADNPGGVHTNTQRTMSVVNASGFVAGEILTLKKVSSTGFNTEYVLVQSSSRFNPSSDTDLSGNIMVQRGYGSGTSGETSGSLGGQPGNATSYSGSQVIVSTGRVGTGYIRLNANPSDQATPFIDIVERTGTGLYDIDLKARLGDLSGLSSARLHGTNPSGQFGLYSKNVFLEGGIVANTGSIAGIKMQSGKLFTGTGTHGNANTGFYVDNTGDFSLKDKLVFDHSAGTLTLKGALRQESDGTPIVDLINKGTWAAGVSYEINNLVQYTVGSNTSTYAAKTNHTSTNDNDVDTGRPDQATNAWAVHAQGSTGATGNTGPSGAAAKGLSVTLDSQTFAFDDNLDTSSTPTSILFSINQQNLSGNVVTSDITITDSGGSTITNPTLVTNVTNGTGTVSGSLSFSSDLGGDKTKLPVVVSVSKDSITDSATIFKIEGGSDGTNGADGEDGTDAYTPILTNESHVVGRASNQAGGAFDLEGSGTEMAVFRGITPLVGRINTAPTTGFYSASFVSDNFTPGTPTIVNNNISFADMTSNPTEDSGSITFTIHAEGSASFTKIQSLSVNQSADSGSDGAPGGSAKSLIITTDSAAYTFVDSSTNTAVPNSIKFTIQQQNLTGTVGTNDITITDSGASTLTNPSLTTNVTDGSGTVTGDVTFSSTVGGVKSKLPITISVSKDSITDAVTIVKVEGGSDGDPGTPGADGEDGTDAYTPILTNETHVVGRDSTQAGGAFDLNGSGTEIIVFRGVTQLTGRINTAPETGFYSASIVENNFTAGTPSIVNNKISFADMTVNPTDVSGSITYTIHAEGSASFTKIQSLSVNQTADSGSDGAPGSPGSPGAAAKSVRLSATAQSFVTGSGGISPASITFTTNRQNTTGTTTYTSSPSSLLTSVSGDTAVLTSTNFGSNTAVTVTATADSISDSITVVRLTEGSDAFTVVVDNESHVVPQSSEQAGGTRNLTGTGTTITAFKGASELNSVTDTPSSGEFKVTATGTGITPSTGTVTGNPFVFPDHSNMTTDNASIGYDVNLENLVTIPKSQSFTTSQAANSGSDGAPGAPGSPGSPGAAGPGVTFTGDWVEGKNYNGGSAIKDVVEYTDGNYYIATADHTSTNTTNSGTGIPGHGPWTSFGAQFESVATDILLAQDSTITRGLVIGNTDGTGSFIRSVDKHSLDAGSGEGFFLSSSGQFVFDNPTQGSFIQMNTSGIEISSSRFHLKNDGDVVVGKVDATEGTIGGFSITGTTISSVSGVTGSLRLTKAVTQKTTAIDVGPTVVSTLNEGRVQIKYNGQITGSLVKFDGGQIGGFSLLNGNLKSGNFVISGSGGGKLATAESGRRVEIDGTSNSLKFFGGVTNPGTVEFSDSLTSYVLAPGFTEGLGNYSLYSYAGIDLDKASLIITPDTTKAFMGVGIKMPHRETNDHGDFVGYGITYGGPASLSIFSEGTTMGGSYTLLQQGTGDVYGQHYRLGHSGGTGQITGIRMDFSDAPEVQNADGGTSLTGFKMTTSPNVDVTGYLGVSGNAAQTEGESFGLYVDMHHTSSMKVGTNPLEYGTSYGIYLDTDVHFKTAGIDHELNYGVYSKSPFNAFAGNIVIGSAAHGTVMSNSARKLYVTGNSYFQGDAHVTGELEVDGNIDLDGNIVGDNSSTISGIDTISATSLTATGTVQAEHLYTTDDLRVDGDIDINGDIIGDDSTDITNIESIYCDYVRADADGTNNYINFADDEISIGAGGAERLSVQDNAIIINEGGVDVNVRIESEDQATMFKIDAGHNTVGIGTSGLRTFHAVMDLAAEAGTPGSYSAYNGPLWERSRASGAGANEWIHANLNTAALQQSILGPSAYDDNIYFYFRDDGSQNSQYVVSIDGSANNFTGQHTVNIVSGSSLLNVDWKGAPQDQLGISGSNINEFAGKIVYATGDYQRWCKVKKQYVSGSEALEINEALPLVDMTSTNTDKRVFGVISDREDRLKKDNDSGDYENDWQMVSGSNGGAQINAAFNFGNLKPGKIRVNSIGEGSIWVCNISGSLSNGDYITTCNVPGYGAKQNDDLLHNYTVAKITTDCDFTTGNYKTGSIEHNGVTYKTAFVGCTYHCG